MAGGSGVAQLGLPGSAGVPAGAVADTLVAPYNVVPDARRRRRLRARRADGRQHEPRGPLPGFLAGLRAECDRVGALLIFDEVITGFRVGPGGMAEVSGVTPDLWIFGKVIGGGLPVGAFGGSAALLEVLAPAGPVYQAGTLSGNPLATAAGLAVLAAMGPDDYAELTERAQRFGRSLEAALIAGGLSARVPIGRTAARSLRGAGR